MRYLPENLYKFRDAMERLGAVAAIDWNLRFISVTASFTELFGYKESDIVGKEIHFLDYAGKDSIFMKEMVDELSTGVTWFGESACKHKDKSSVPTRIAIAPSLNAKNDIVGYVAQYQRIALPHSQFELSDILYRYRAGFNKLSALSIIASNGDIQEVNELFLDMYGYTREEIIGKKISFLRSDSTPEDKYTEIQETLLSGKTWREEIENKRKDGRPIFVRAIAAPSSLRHNHENTDYAFLMLHQDITDERELRTIQQDLALEAARQQMLRGTIHDIGNLQTSLLAANTTALQHAQGLEQACTQAQKHHGNLADLQDKETFLLQMHSIVQKAAESLRQNIQKERKAIDDTIAVLESWRAHQQNIRPVEDESIQSFVQRTLNTFSIPAAQHQVAVAISAMCDVQVRWPTTQVQQMFYNLLINALQAIAGQVACGAMAPTRGRIDIAITQEDEEIVIGVKDNGGGFFVAAEQLFAPKYTTKKTGAGIGLHTAAIMAQSMGGSISADNTMLDARRGAYFVLRLPRIVAGISGTEKTV